MHFTTLLQRQHFTAPDRVVAEATVGRMDVIGLTIDGPDRQESERIYSLTVDFDVSLEDLNAGDGEAMAESIVDAMRALIGSGAGDFVLLHNGDTELLRRRDGRLYFSGSRWWQSRLKRIAA